MEWPRTMQFAQGGAVVEQQDLGGFHAVLRKDLPGTSIKTLYALDLYRDGQEVPEHIYTAEVSTHGRATGTETEVFLCCTTETTHATLKVEGDWGDYETFRSEALESAHAYVASQKLQ